MDLVLRASGVEKAYGDVVALAGVDLEVDAGRIVALLGRNGAGKSTLLSIIAGLLSADRGRIEVGGIDARAHPVRAGRLMGIAPQETGVYPVLSVRRNLEFFGDLAGVERRDRRARAELVAGQLGLTPLLDRPARQLSGGEVRRLHTACALVNRPQLLMLDEPTVGADVETRRQLIEAVGNLAADGAAVVYTTHYLAEVEALDADIVIIDAGRVLARGTRDELIAAHHQGGLRFSLDGPLDVTPDGLQIEHLGGSHHRVAGEMAIDELLERLGPLAARVHSIERNRPDLESVFLAVTGRDLGDGTDGADGPDGPAVVRADGPGGQA